eukprot:COSAG05_NODE_1473_length_4788_cov_2.548305_5_plen_55_part_00
MLLRGGIEYGLCAQGGAVIAPMLRAANAIADALKADGHDHVMIDTFAYHPLSVV